MKLLFFDTETSGTCFWLHGIHQIAGIIEIDGVERERFEWNIRLHPAALIDDSSLAVSNVTREDLVSFAYFEQKEVHKSLTELMGKYVDKYNSKDKFYLVGYNYASFDNPFLRAFFKQCGDDYFGSWFWSCPIDVMVLAGQYLLEDRPQMENFQQSTVAKRFGIEIDKTRLHDAVYDVEIMVKIYKFMYPL